jgi:hypothetical protein
MITFDDRFGPYIARAFRLADRHDGWFPGELMEWAETVLSPPQEDPPVVVLPVDPQARARALGAARWRRWKLRQQGQDVPLLRSGRADQADIVSRLAAR